MRDYILYAVKQGKKNHVFYFENDFLYTDSKKQAQVRDRSKLPGSAKKIELVSKQEMQAALILVITAAFSLSEEEAVSSSLSLMGFGKATAVVTVPVKNVLKKMLVYGSLKCDDNNKISIGEDYNKQNPGSFA